MIALVTKSNDQAKTRSSKRITASHLKQAVGAEGTFDFLSDIISKVPDAPAPEEGDEHGEGKKKRGGRKKKADSDDE
jgi:Dr1-associated corepressor